METQYLRDLDFCKAIFIIALPPSTRLQTRAHKSMKLSIFNKDSHLEKGKLFLLVKLFMMLM